MQPTKAQEITASQLVSDSPSPAPVKKPRAPWPDGVPIRETFPGSKIVRHPLDKGFISIADAQALGGKLEAMAAPVKPASTAAEVKPEATAAQPTAATPPPAPQPTAQPEATPDFSELNGGPKPQGGAPETVIDAMASHRVMGGMFHGAIEGLCCGIFGEGFKTNETEKNQLTEHWAKALEWWQMRVCNPAEQLAAAYGCYFTARIGLILGKAKLWWANRKVKKVATEFVRKNQPNVTETPKPEAAQPEIVAEETAGSVFDEVK